MAFKRRIPLTQINGVAKGATASINLPLGVRYHEIHLRYGTSTAGGPTEANMVAEIGDIRVNMNGVLQRVYAMQDLFNINRTKGKSPVVGATDGFIQLFFREPLARTTLEREATAWGTQGVDTLQIEVDIINNANQTPALSGWAVVDDVQEPPKGIVKVTRETIQIAATGDVTYNLGPGKGDSVKNLFFIENTAGDITALKLNWDGVKAWDITKAVEASMDAASDNTVVAKVRQAYLDANTPSDALPMFKPDPQNPGKLVKVQDFNAVLTMANAANVKLYRELLGAPN